MAPVPTFCRVVFLDASGNESEVRYRLKTSFDDALENIEDVLLNVSSMQSALNAMTWDQITHAYLEIDLPEISAAPNIAANNQVYAFLSALTESGEKSSAVVPAWDDLLFAQDKNHLLSPAFNVEAQDFVENFIVDPETGEDLTFQYSVSRSRKSRGKQLV